LCRNELHFWMIKKNVQLPGIKGTIFSEIQINFFKNVKFAQICILI